MKIIDGEEVFGIEDVIYPEESQCEHCWHLPPFTALVDCDGVNYCIDCCSAGGSDFQITKEELKTIETTQANYKIGYHKAEIARLEDRLSFINKEEK